VDVTFNVIPNFSGLISEGTVGPSPDST
jgi:hypothetical protein